MTVQTENDVSGPPRPPVKGGYFAQRIVLPWELPSIMRKHTYTGAMGNVWGWLISGIFFVYFGTSVGLTKFQWGLMAGISSWLIPAQLLSAAFTQRVGRRKAVWFCFSAAARCLRLAGILLALWFWHAGWAHAGVLLIAAICLANFFAAMAEPPWMSWLADIIPAARHGTFWGRRAAWIALSVVTVLLASSLLVDRVPQEGKIHVVVAIFILASVIGMLDLLIHGTIPEPAPLMPEQKHFFHQVLQPLRDRGYRPWLVFNVCWTFSMTLGGSLSMLYFLDELGIRNNLLGGTLSLTCFSLLGGLLTAAWSGRLVDRLGTRRMLFWGHLFWASLPLSWLLARPGSPLMWLWLGVGGLIGGVSSTAATNAATKLITRLPPPQFRAMYVAVSSSLGSLAGGLGAVVAGSTLRLTDNWAFAAPWGAVGGFHLLFIASLCLRFGSAALLLPRIRE